jgi:hypothetical protein
MKELLIRKKLDELEDELVRRAEKLVDNNPGITITRGKGKGLEDSQIRNIIAVANETSSLAVVENFIKYQIGRIDKPNEKWRFREKDEAGFGETLLQELRWLRELAASKAEGEVTPQDLEIRFARLYLGFLMRYFKYAQVREGGGES